MGNAALTEALAKLDVENDSHWTADDAPDVKVVQELVGDDTVTRDHIREVAPVFSRKNLVIGEPPTPKQEQEIEDAKRDDEAKEKEKEGASEQANRDEALRSKKAEVEAEISDLSSSILSIDQTIAELKNQKDVFLKDRDVLIERLEKEFPRPNAAEVRKEWLRKQHELRMKRAQGMKQLHELVGGKVPTSAKSPIDQALTNRKRQVQRPPAAQ